MEGLVIKSTGSFYQIKLDDGSLKDARVKGKLRLKGIDSTNPIAVGDRVTCQPEGQNDMLVISDILPRKNYIIRKSNKLSKQTQVIAANLDQAVLVVTVNYPKTTNGFIDRFLLTAEAYHIPVLLVFNKLDLYLPQEVAQMHAIRKLYESIGFTCCMVSAKTGQNINILKNHLLHKTSLIAGHSGTGKSTLINFINPKIGQKTGIISDYSNKGKHTTTFAEMFEILPETYIIDTPGIKDFGVVHLERSEVKDYFPEFRLRMSKCKFNNCIHLNEPGCAIIDAVGHGEIAMERYNSYLSIMQGDDAHH